MSFSGCKFLLEICSFWDFQGTIFVPWKYNLCRIVFIMPCCMYLVETLFWKSQFNCFILRETWKKYGKKFFTPNFYHWFEIELGKVIFTTNFKLFIIDLDMKYLVLLYAISFTYFPLKPSHHQFSYCLSYRSK